ncbi:hypothetical protein OROHE_013354 [Orobanche hederae]
MMVYLTEDLITEILLRLPVICLLRCLCICKDWHRLIRSPRFVDLHFNHPSSQDNRSHFLIFSSMNKHRMIMSALLYYCLDNIDGSLLNMPFRPPFVPAFSFFFQQLIISSHCNGLFCVIEKAFEPSEGYVFMCNPATRQFRRLPKRPLPKPSCNGTSSCGLGIDPRTNRYNVTVLSCDLEDLDDISVAYKVGIYNLSSNSWREVETVLPRAEDSDYKVGIYNLNSNSWREVERVWPRAMKAGDSDYYMPLWVGGGFYFNECLH